MIQKVDELNFLQEYLQQPFFLMKCFKNWTIKNQVLIFFLLLICSISLILIFFVFLEGYLINLSLTSAS